jgi:hydrogenase maturation protease
VRRAPPMPTSALIIAFGNPLRSDDGIGWHAAELLRREFTRSQVEIVCVHQLAPELAEAASRAGKVIFVDAACSGEPGQITCAEVPAGEMTGLSHQLSPVQLIALSHELYGRRPHAYIVSITGESFDHGEGLSYTLTNALGLLIEAVRDLIAGQAESIR